MIDTFDHGTLEKYDPSSLIADPECETLAEHINETFAVFKQETAAKKFGILIYRSGTIRLFDKKADLIRFIKSAYPSLSFPEMMNPERFYKWMWKTVERKQRSEPQKFAK